MLEPGPIKREVVINGVIHNFTVRRSRRARRLAIHVDMWRGIEVVIPRWASLVAATRFVREKESWIATQLDYAAKLKADTPHYKLITGESIPLLGQKILLIVTKESDRQRAKVIQKENQLNAVLPARTTVKSALTRWYRAQARAYFTQKSYDLARLLGVNVTKISIGEQRSQWGSAGIKGRLSFNWRLLLAPEEIAAYVAAHEVAHLKHHDHSRAFWETVALLDPDYKTHRTWLKRRGYSLVL